jgi:hypothetical protein
LNLYIILNYVTAIFNAKTFCIVDCVDVGQYCHDWAAKGECTNNPGYMLVSCKKSCNHCGSTGIMKIAFNEGRHTYIIVTDMEVITKVITPREIFNDPD